MAFSLFHTSRGATRVLLGAGALLVTGFWCAGCAPGQEDVTAAAAASIRTAVQETKQQIPARRRQMGPIYLNTRRTRKAVREAELDAFDHAALTSALPPPLAWRVRPGVELEEVRASRRFAHAPQHGRRASISRGGIYVYVADFSEAAGGGYHVEVVTKHSNPKQVRPKYGNLQSGVTFETAATPQTLKMNFTIEERSGTWTVTDPAISEVEP